MSSRGMVLLSVGLMFNVITFSAAENTPENPVKQGWKAFLREKGASVATTMKSAVTTMKSTVDKLGEKALQEADRSEANLKQKALEASTESSIVDNPTSEITTALPDTASSEQVASVAPAAKETPVLAVVSEKATDLAQSTASAEPVSVVVPVNQESPVSSAVSELHKVSSAASTVTSSEQVPVQAPVEPTVLAPKTEANPDVAPIASQEPVVASDKASSEIPAIAVSEQASVETPKKEVNPDVDSAVVSTAQDDASVLSIVESSQKTPVVVQDASWNTYYVVGTVAAASTVVGAIGYWYSMSSWYRSVRKMVAQAQLNPNIIIDDLSSLLDVWEGYDQQRQIVEYVEVHVTMTPELTALLDLYKYKSL